jgi:hypothetical protein
VCRPARAVTVARTVSTALLNLPSAAVISVGVPPRHGGVSM